MTEPVTIRCRENGPLVIQAPIKILDHLGNEFVIPVGKETVALCRCTRTAKVFMPRSMSHAAIGSRACPHTCISFRTSSITASDPATAPAITSECPFRYLVAL